MPLKLDLSQFSLNQFRSYARFDNGQEEKLRSALDHHFAVERLVCALETAIKHRPGILIGGVPIGESTDGRIVFQITCMHKIENGVACDDFFTAVCHRVSVEEFCAELEQHRRRRASAGSPPLGSGLLDGAKSGRRSICVLPRLRRRSIR